MNAHDKWLFSFLLRTHLRPFAQASTVLSDTHIEVSKVIERFGEIADSIGSFYAEFDREPCSLTAAGEVRLPRKLKSLWSGVKADLRLDLAAFPSTDRLGLLPRLLRQIAAEMLLGANPAFMAYGGFTHMAIPIIERFGTDAQRSLFVAAMKRGDWDACFCVTESHAGSDLNDIGTSAALTSEAGVYRLTGTKAYITAGMHDLTENTVYIVLARTRKDAALSCFLVPRLWYDPSGKLVDNGVRCVKVDEKMGLRGCANTHLSFGSTNPSIGILLGKREGMGFHHVAPLMREARISTALFGLGLSEQALKAARDFAVTRVQGRLLGANPRGPQTPIINHADVQRMLLEMASRTGSFRGMIALYQGQQALADSRDISEEAALRAEALASLYVPLLKAYVSDNAWRVCELAIQIHGGAGYTGAHKVEQYARDVKVLSLWEGTNYIQSLDLISGKLKFGRHSLAWQAFCDDFVAFLDSAKIHPWLGVETIALEAAYLRIVDLFDGIAPICQSEGFPALGHFATQYLHCLGDLVAARALLMDALEASRALDEEAVDAQVRIWLNGRLKVCRFFTTNLLPLMHARADLVAKAMSCVIPVAPAELGWISDDDCASSDIDLVMTHRAFEEQTL